MILPKIPSKIDLSILNKICSTNNCYDIKKCKFPTNTQRIRKQHIIKKLYLIIKLKLINIKYMIQ
jgi:hypothetical protein